MTKIWVSRRFDAIWLEPQPHMLFAEDHGGELPTDDEFAPGPLMLTEPSQGPGQISPGGAVSFWVRYDPPIAGIEPAAPVRLCVPTCGLTIGERPSLLARIWHALWRLVRRTR